MPLRVLQTLQIGGRASLVPTSGVLGARVRGFINGAITSNLGAARAVRVFRDLGNVVSGAEFFDQYARQYAERELSRRVQALGPNDLPSQSDVLESRFKVPESYRYRIKIFTQESLTNETGEKYMSIYSSGRLTPEEVEELAIGSFDELVFISDPTLLEMGFRPIGASLELVEHNFGAPY